MPAITPPSATVIPNPSITAYVFGTQAGAQAISDAVDLALGYPKVCVEVGGGIHYKDPNNGGPASTLTWDQIIEHPTLALWAYPASPQAAAILTGRIGLPVPILLTNDWFPSTSVITTGQVVRAAIAATFIGIAASAVLTQTPAQAPTAPTQDADIVQQDDAGAAFDDVAVDGQD